MNVKYLLDEIRINTVYNYLYYQDDYNAILEYQYSTWKSGHVYMKTKDFINNSHKILVVSKSDKITNDKIKL